MNLGIEITAVLEVSHVEGRLHEVGQIFGLCLLLDQHSNDVAYVSDKSFISDFENGYCDRDVGSLLKVDLRGVPSLILTEYFDKVLGDEFEWCWKCGHLLVIWLHRCEGCKR